METVMVGTRNAPEGALPPGLTYLLELVRTTADDERTDLMASLLAEIEYLGANASPQFWVGLGERSGPSLTFGRLGPTGSHFERAPSDPAVICRLCGRNCD